MSSELAALDQLNEVKDIAADIVGPGLTYGPGTNNECAVGYASFLERTAEFGQVSSEAKNTVWREAAGFDPVTGVPSVDLVSGESN